MLAILLTVFVVGAPAPALEKPTADDLKAAEKLVQDRLTELKSNNAQMGLIRSEALENTLPGHVFYSVRFRLFPIAQQPPETLKSANVFVVVKDKLTVISEANSLEKWFRSALKPVKEDKALKDAALAYLRLVQEMYQDGFYEFEVVPEATKVEADKDGKTATARCVVMKGGNGEISVVLTFVDEKLIKATETAKLQRGPRPKCHATKLLDPDPVVRAIVEEDLLIMGRAARPYLDEQRAKASPELRKAIDRMWQRIEEANRQH
jgi:hypothetical protein